MPKPINSKNLFSFESADTSANPVELPEQGTIEVADSEEVVAEAKPSEDVTEAGDDLAQATPNAEIDAEPETDITTTETVVEGTDDEPLEEITKLASDGETASATKDEIVAAAQAEITGDPATDTDVNGNAITPEQADENAAEEEVVDEVETETEESSKNKSIDDTVEDVTESVDESLDNISDVETDGGVDAESTDDTSDDIDSGGDEGDLGMDADLGGDGDPAGGDDSEFDDTPLEGADDQATDSTVDGSDGDISSPETAEGTDQTDVESDDGGDLGDPDVTDDTTGIDGDAPVADEVAKQNEAADVTAEAASADAEQTDFIAGDTPEQHGEPDNGTLPDNDGEEIVAEAKPAIQNETDVGSDNANADITQTTEDEVEFDDDTPLEGAEPLTVEVDESLTPTEVDGQEADGPTGDGATVEESQSDQQAEAIDEAVEAEETDIEEGDDEQAAGSDEPEDGESDVVTEEESYTDGSNAEVVEGSDITSDSEEPGIDAEAGEVEENTEEADLDEGELDIPDVDDETTEVEVDEAADEADIVEAEADAETEEGDKADKTIEELQKEAEALEEFRVMLDWGIANESYDPGLLAYMVSKTDKVRNVLNELGCDYKAVALEQYSGKDLDLAYRVTLESVRGFLSRLTTIKYQLSQKVEKLWSKGMVDKVKTRTTALNKQIDLCLVQLKDSDGTTKDISAIGGYLAHAEGNLVKAVSDDLKTVTDVSSKGFKATEELQANLVKALNDITASASPEEATSIADKVSRFKDTKSAFPNRAFDKGFLGGYHFELKEATSGDALKDKILNMGRRAVPVVVKTGKGDNTSQKLSKGDISNLLKMAKAYVALADKLAGTVGDRAVDNVSKLRLTRERVLPVGVEGRIRGGDEKAIDSAASALEIVAKAHNDLYKFITKHCIDTADALCGVAKKFTK